MSGMIFALALFGCTDDGSACQRLTAHEQTYESRVECMAAQSGALESPISDTADYPSVLAQCMTRTQLAHLGQGTVDLRRSSLSFADAAH